MVRDPPLRDSVLVQRNVVRADLERVPLVVKLGPVAQVSLEAHLVLELLGLLWNAQVVRRDRTQEGVLVRHRLGAVGLHLNGARQRMVELQGRVWSHANEAGRAYRI